MGIFGSGEGYYAGRECHRYVERIILQGREVLIISPYIDGHYARFLQDNSQGRRIRVISSSMAPDASKALRGARPLGLLLAVLLLATSFNWLAILAGFFSVATLLPALATATASLAMFLRRSGRVEVRVPRRFVHAKLYISERMAAHGSANLTYSGMHRNVEHLEITYDPQRIGRLRKEFLEIWDEM